MEDDVGPLEAWIEGLDATRTIDEASVSVIRERVREEGRRAGIAEHPVAAMVNVASELAYNQLRHAFRGVVAVRPVVGEGGPGIEVVAADQGPGIVDVARALEGRPSGRTSLGAGLAAVLELADEVDIDVRLEEGTCVWARKYDHATTRGRRVGVYGRAFPGEPVSGDDAAFVRSHGSLLVGLADGLGHGLPAREASARATRVLRAGGGRAPDQVLAQCDAALASSRGAVMTVARLDDLGSLTLAAVGNVGALLLGLGPTGRFGGSSFVLGAPGGARRIASETSALSSRDVLVLYSDGIRSRMDLTGEHDLLREHPVLVAQRVVERFARDDDDVLVLVVG